MTVGEKNANAEGIALPRARRVPRLRGRPETSPATLAEDGDEMAAGGCAGISKTFIDNFVSGEQLCIRYAREFELAGFYSTANAQLINSAVRCSELAWSGGICPVRPLLPDSVVWGPRTL